jgi:RND family efflux transporter MFP subunit
VANPNLKDDLASLRIDSSARAGGRGRSVWAFLFILAIAVAAGGWFWARREPVIDVKTATVTVPKGAGSTATEVLKGSGYVVARRRATVSSKVTGKVLEIFVEEGRPVRKGQILARLDDSQVRAGLKVGEAQLAAAERGAAEHEARLREANATLERRRQLVRDQVISKAELDSAEAEVESLKARIALAHQQVEVARSQINATKTELDDMVVRAPFDGVAISKDAQPGEMISPVSAGGGFTRTGICTIVDMSSLEIEVDVNQQRISVVRPGQPVEAVLDAYPEWRIPAHVITMVPAADRQKSTVRVRIAFDKLDARILPDMGVGTSFLAPRTPEAPDAPAQARLLAPKNALRASGDVSVVFVVHGDRVERRAVKVGLDDGGQVEITSGLSPGDKVVVDPPATLADGTRVKER